MDKTKPSSVPGRMGFVQIPDGLRAWPGGSAQELAEVAQEALAETAVPDADLNERLVRYYVTSGVLDAPVKRGREAVFELRHLVQLMVVRNLLAERLSLGQIRDLFRTIDWSKVDEVAELLPKPAPVTEAERLVSQFRGGASPVRHILQSKRQQWAEQRVGGRDARPLVRWRLSPWLEVLADPAAVQRLTDEQAERLGVELTAVLVELRDQGR